MIERHQLQATDVVKEERGSENCAGLKHLAGNNTIVVVDVVIIAFIIIIILIIIIVMKLKT